MAALPDAMLSCISPDLPAIAYMCKLFWYWKSYLDLGCAMQLRMCEMGAEHVNERTKGEHGGLLVCNSMSTQNACSLDCGQRGPQVHLWKAQKWKVIFSIVETGPPLLVAEQFRSS